MNNKKINCHTLKCCSVLGRMHELKEISRHFEKSNDWLEGLFNLVSWLLSAANYFPKVIKPFVFDEIIAYFDNRTTNGVVEGINNVKAD